MNKLRRGQDRVRFTPMPNAVARDYRLSWRARGLLLELLSYPPGYETTIDDLAKRAKRVNPNAEGRDALRKAKHELEAAGYIITRRWQNERGHWLTDLEITDEPLLQFALQENPRGPGADAARGADSVGDAQAGQAPARPDGTVSAGRTDDGFSGVGNPGVGSPVAGSPGVGSPVVGSSGVIKKTDPKTEKKTVKKTVQRSVPPTPPAGDGGRTAGRDQPATAAEPDEFVQRAGELLAGLRVRDTRLTLGSDQVAELAPGVARWLQAGHSAAAVEAVLAEGDWSPSATHSVVGTLRWRLQHREPTARPVSRPREPAYRAPSGGATAGLGPAGNPQVAQLLAQSRAAAAEASARMRQPNGGRPSAPRQPGGISGEHPP